MNFPQRLRECRKACNKTQQQLSDCLGYNCATISNYETGKNEPSFRDLVRIAEILDTSIDYLLGIEDVKYPFPKKENDQQITSFIKLFSTLEEETQSALLHILKNICKEQNIIS